MLRGQVGTQVKVKINRPTLEGGYQPMDFELVRQSIQTQPILHTTLMQDSIGYINLNTFSGNPSKEFKKAFQNLKKQGATSLIIDLRNNGGGLLDEAVEIVNFFVPRGKTIVTT